jgi:hypothetical protein
MEERCHVFLLFLVYCRSYVLFSKSSLSISYIFTLRNCCGRLLAEIRDIEADYQEAFFIVPAQTQRTVSKGWAPRTKGSHLIYPCKQVTEAKSKVWSIYAYIKFYWLLYPSAMWLSPPSAKWPSSCSDFSSFISLLCHPYLPAFLGLMLRPFSSDPPPCYKMRNIFVTFCIRWATPHHFVAT